MLFAAFIGIGCNQIKDAIIINKDLDYNATLEVNGVPGLPDTVVSLPQSGVRADFPKVTSATNAQQYMTDYNTSGDNVSSVIISKMSLEMTQPDGQDFNFIDSVNVYLSASGLDELLMGYRYDIPKGTKTIDLTREDNNIKEYFLKDSVSFRISAHFVEIPKDSGKMDLKTVFGLVAKPLK